VKEKFYKIMKVVLAIRKAFSTFLVLLCSCTTVQDEESIKTEVLPENYIKVEHFFGCISNSMYTRNCNCKEHSNGTIDHSLRDSIIINQVVVNYVVKQVNALKPNVKQLDSIWFDGCFSAFIHVGKKTTCLCMGLTGIKVDGVLMKDSPFLHLILKYYSGFYSDYGVDFSLHNCPEINLFLNTNPYPR